MASQTAGKRGVVALLSRYRVFIGSSGKGQRPGTAGRLPTNDVLPPVLAYCNAGRAAEVGGMVLGKRTLATQARCSAGGDLPPFGRENFRSSCLDCVRLSATLSPDRVRMFRTASAFIGG